MSGLEEIYGKLRRWTKLPLCMPRRPSFDWAKFEMGAMRSADDLPPYLVMGLLDKTAISANSLGGVVQWRSDDEDTYIELSGKVGHPATLRQVWKGLEGGTTVVGEGGLQRAIGALYASFPEAWDHAAADDFESLYLLKWHKSASGMASFCGVPDGAFRVACLPLRLDLVAPFIQFWRETLPALNLPWPVTGGVRLRMCTMNFVVGVAPAWATEPPVVFHHALVQSGLVPLGLPKIEHGRDGSSACTVRMYTYLAMIQVPFVGVEAMLAILNKAGFIADTEAPAEDTLTFPAPFVIPQGLEVQMRDFSWFDHGGARRTYWQLINDAEDPMSLVSDWNIEPDDEALNELVSSSEVVRSASERWLQNVLNKATGA